MNRRTVNRSALLRTAKWHDDWASETRSPAPPIEESVPPQSTSSTAESLAKSVDDGLKAKGWIIATVQDSFGQPALQVGRQPVIYLDETILTSTMERRAKNNPGTKYVAPRVHKTVVVAASALWS